ncbi:cadmium resistance protein CadD [Companilactobacillus sp. RD055328]|uniref:CadD family cadmium resistance transporter n=1 Tax=Companilactobacillus sp. RD055328 TaxID=2916634 RepID=UPI001FC80EF9|nr:CadD family cadmium resistance transporter [Companilactobacillus sp. RD055328]GKQ43348.1 cadmium resistance protein CadD [Companilactobacillus sp. RD055328]
MGAIVLSSITAYISTSIDYLIILMLVFGTAKTSKQRWAVYFGDIIGTAILVTTSLIMAFVLKFVPDEWILGLLGIIPIFMGIKLLIKGEEDDDEIVEKALGKDRSLMLNVAIITIATCGADNIGIYVPYFVTLNAAQVIIVLITFFVMLSLFCWIGYTLVKLPKVADILEDYGRWITAIVYILLGIYIMIESGTIAHFI